MRTSSRSRRPPAARSVARLTCILVAAAVAPVAAVAQSDLYDLSLVDDAFEAESERMAGIGVYVEVLENFGMAGLSVAGIGGPCGANCIVHKVEEIVTPGADGVSYMDYIMSMLEVFVYAGIGMGADMMQNLGTGMQMAQILANSQMGGIVPPVGDAWMNPQMMFSAGGEMLNEGAQARRDAAASLASSNEQTQVAAVQSQRVRERLQPIGSQDGILGPMTCFRADGLDMPMEAGDGQTATMTAAGVCIDNDEHVIVEHRIEGTMIAEGDAHPFFIEVENSDFRQVAGCDLYKPYRRTMRMGGMLNDEQMAEINEARAQLAEFEAQLAAMPPAQRAMMENMMGGQMDMIRNMANGGAIEHVQELQEILCDPDLKALFSPVDPALELAQIQRDLVTLGYMPGNTDGVMDTLTEIAISQYQAERGIPVTGQPSTDLALRLASEVAGQG